MDTRPPLYRRRAFWIATGSLAIVVLLGSLAFAAWTRGGGSEQVGGISGGQSPWPADPPGLTTRLSNAGLTALTSEGTALHIHEHLDLFIHGQQVTIPADIGIDTTAGILSAIHTHDTTGVIHVESPTVNSFFLGQFFQVWGVPFNSQCIGSYCAGSGNVLKMWVNGQEYTTGGPDTLQLQAHQEIVIAFGTPAEIPTTIPSTYDWSGL